MCQRSPERYEETRRALQALAGRLRSLAERARAVDPGRFPPAERHRVEAAAREAERLLEETLRLAEDLAAWDPYESVCYGEFWSRIRRIEGLLPGLEDLVSSLEAAARGYRVLPRPAKYVVEIEDGGKRWAVVTPRTRDPWAWALRYTSAWGGRVAAIYPLEEKVRTA